MPVHPPACCKAVQRQLLTPSDSVWVSEQVLSLAFQRFCSISRTSRRHGSSVPGPMESRRRLGKRRMTYVSEAMPSSAHNLRSTWGSFWEPDRTQWQWQAPTPRAPNHDRSATALPSWLLDWDSTPEGQEVEKVDVETVESESLQWHATIEDDIRQFREGLRKSNSDKDTTTLLQNFSATFKTSLTLGLVSVETLGGALQQVSIDIKEACSRDELATGLSLTFYTAVWEGIEASKVLGPTEVDIKVLDRLVSLVASLEFTTKLQSLIHRILHSVSEIQLRSMAHTITSLVQRWSESWRLAQESVRCAEQLQIAESSAAGAADRVVNARTLIVALKDPNLGQDVSIAVEALKAARVAFSEAIDATFKAEDRMSPLRVSIRALALAVGTLPQDLVVSLLRSCTAHVVTLSDTLTISSWSFRYQWLCAVAQMPNVGDNQLVRAWKALDPLNNFRDNKCVEVVLSHWISRDKVGDPASVTNTYEASSQHSLEGKRSSSFARLLLALDKHREMCFTRTGDLFYLLPQLGRQRQISDILLRMAELHMKIPTTMLGAEVEKMSAHDMKRALDMWFLPWEMKLGYPLRPDFIPRFIISLVDDPETTPVMIWKLLNIPIYNPKWNHRHRLPNPSHIKPLPKEMIDLIHQMARAFARSDARPPRVAFRNVVQCLHHLRIHNAPISPDLTRAVTYAVSTRPIMSGNDVGKERLRYALNLVAKIEGEEVAKEVDETVYIWRQFVKSRRIQVGRDRNPLRVGVIG